MARNLLGQVVCKQDGTGLSALRVVETEAYLGSEDRASHAHGGRRTKRTSALWLAGGHAYVYLVYGLHWCLNAVTGTGDDGDAVLLRAGTCVAGEEAMARRRGRGRLPPERHLAGGPGRLAAALGVDGRWTGTAWRHGDLWIAQGERVPDSEVAMGPRIGVGYAGEAAKWPLRFAVAGEPAVSSPRPTLPYVP